MKRALRNNAPTTYILFLWMLAALSSYAGCIYPAYSGLSGRGDWHAVIDGLPDQLVLRTIECGIGIIAGAWLVHLFAEGRELFPDYRWRLTLLPYMSSTVIFCIAGLRIPHGGTLMMTSVAPGVLLGQSIFLLVLPFARRQSTGAPLITPIPSDMGIITLALLGIVAILLTALSLSFTLP